MLMDEHILDLGLKENNTGKAYIKLRIQNQNMEYGIVENEKSGSK